MKIEKIERYRDGGTISIIVSDIEKSILDELELPTKPKYIKEGIIFYEVFRNFSIGSKDKCNYFFGDINGEFKQLFLYNPILLEVKHLLEQEKLKRGFYDIEKFMINL